MATPKRAAARAKPAAESVKKAPDAAQKPPPDLVIRGLTAEDIAALEAEAARRRALLPLGANLPRNAVAVAVFQAGLAAVAAEAAREQGAAS